MTAGPSTRFEGQMETRFCREVSWAVTKHTACTKPSWGGERRRKREPQSRGNHRAVALDGVLSSTGTQTHTATWASVLDKSRRKGARSYLVMPADSEFPISIGYWQVEVPERARTNTSVVAAATREGAVLAALQTQFSLLLALHLGQTGEGVREVENPCWKGILAVC